MDSWHPGLHRHPEMVYVFYWDSYSDSELLFIYGGKLPRQEVVDRVERHMTFMGSSFEVIAVAEKFEWLNIEMVDITTDRYGLKI